MARSPDLKSVVRKDRRLRLPPSTPVAQFIAVLAMSVRPPKNNDLMLTGEGNIATWACGSAILIPYGIAPLFSERILAEKSGAELI
jgi:hypothetical protein